MNPEQNQETAINGEEPKAPRRRLPHLPKPRAPEPLARGLFSVQERVLWPLQDRLTPNGLGPNRKLVIGGGLGTIAVVAVVAFSGGGSTSEPAAPQVAIEAAAPRQPLSSAPAEPAPEKTQPKGPTLHGAVPVFTPPAAERTRANSKGETKPEGEEKLGSSKAVDTGAAPSDAQDAAAAATAGTTTLSSPAAARISSDPKNSKPAPDAASARAAAAQSILPEGPPAGPAALKVARQFAQGFVVYETGGAEGEFKGAFDRSATPELSAALTKRPPRQPAGVEVPRAKVVNVVAGPSQGTVYKVSVSLLRVGVTSELRLDLEKLKRGGWRVTNILG
jgi:hypothetical protein